VLTNTIAATTWRGIKSERGSRRNAGPRAVGPTGSARRTSCGRTSRSRMAGSSTRGTSATTGRFSAVYLPDLQQEPVIGPTSARFVQTVCVGAAAVHRRDAGPLEACDPDHPGRSGLVTMGELATDSTLSSRQGDLVSMRRGMRCSCPTTSRSRRPCRHRRTQRISISAQSVRGCRARSPSGNRGCGRRRTAGILPGAFAPLARARGRDDGTAAHRGFGTASALASSRGPMTPLTTKDDAVRSATNAPAWLRVDPLLSGVPDVAGAKIAVAFAP
jgi:hypothetical protein